MFTVLVITSTNQVTQFSVSHFATLALAQAYQPQGVECSVECTIYPGNLSEEQAISEYLS